MAGILVVITPNGEQTRTPYHGLTPSLAELQTAVGGYVEQIHCYHDGVERTAFVDEDGYPKQLPQNPAASLLCHRFGVRGIVGNMAIVVPQ